MIVNRDSAVSPVIGVLLMLVVTIIIAAVVSGFAGSLASDQTVAPQASLSVKSSVQNISDTNTSNYIADYPTGFTAANGLIFEHKGGDSFSLSDINVQLQSGSTKILIGASDNWSTPTCLPSSVTAYLMKVGATDLFIKPGDKFMLYSDNCRIDTSGPTLTWKKGGKSYGFAAYLNTKCEYKVIDKKSGKVIQQGPFILQ